MIINTEISKKKGFTLAEILVTLGVIGIVASMTIPLIVDFYQEQEAVSKVKETYSLVSQAIKQWENENGCPGEAYLCIQSMPWNWGTDSGTNFEDGQEMRLGWTKYLKVIDKRLRTPSIASKPWLNYENYNIDGTINNVYGASNSTYVGVSKNNEAHRNFHYLLNNGVVLSVSSAVGDFIWMDINGPKKPNRIAKDQFPIGIGRWKGRYSVMPYFTESVWIRSTKGFCSELAPNPCNPDDGRSPTAYVLKYGKLPDLTAMGYPATP